MSRQAADEPTGTEEQLMPLTSAETEALGNFGSASPWPTRPHMANMGHFGPFPGNSGQYGRGRVSFCFVYCARPQVVHDWATRKWRQYLLIGNSH